MTGSLFLSHHRESALSILFNLKLYDGFFLVGR